MVIAAVEVTVKVSPLVVISVAPSPKVLMSALIVDDPEKVNVSRLLKVPSAYHPKSSDPTVPSESRYKPSKL